MKARLFDVPQPVCDPDCPSVGHDWRGILWPETDGEEFRRNGVSRSMQHCRSCGARRVTRFTPSVAKRGQTDGTWTVEGFLASGR